MKKYLIALIADEVKHNVKFIEVSEDYVGHICKKVSNRELLTFYHPEVDVYTFVEWSSIKAIVPSSEEAFDDIASDGEDLIEGWELV